MCHKYHRWCEWNVVSITGKAYVINITGEVNGMPLASQVR